MKIKLRWCPVDKKPTLQVKRKDGWGKTLWYCLKCSRYNRDVNTREEAKEKVEEEVKRIRKDAKSEQDFRDWQNKSKPLDDVYIKVEPKDFKLRNDWREE